MKYSLIAFIQLVHLRPLVNQVRMGDASEGHQRPRLSLLFTSYWLVHWWINQAGRTTNTQSSDRSIEAFIFIAFFLLNSFTLTFFKITSQAISLQFNIFLPMKKSSTQKAAQESCHLIIGNILSLFLIICWRLHCRLLTHQVHDFKFLSTFSPISSFHLSTLPSTQLSKNEQGTFLRMFKNYIIFNYLSRSLFLGACLNNSKLPLKKEEVCRISTRTT